MRREKLERLVGELYDEWPSGEGSQGRKPWHGLNGRQREDFVSAFELAVLRSGVEVEIDGESVE